MNGIGGTVVGRRGGGGRLGGRRPGLCYTSLRRHRAPRAHLGARGPARRADSEVTGGIGPWSRQGHQGTRGGKAEDMP